MPVHPKRPLEEKLGWMRQRQLEKERKAAWEQEQESKQLREEQEEAATQRACLGETIRQAKLRQAVFEAAPRQREIAPERKMLRVWEVAEILAVSPDTVRRWFAPRAVIVPTGPCKTTMLISQKALDDWFAEHQAKPQAVRR